MSSIYAKACVSDCGKKERKKIHEEITAVVWNTHEAVFCSSMKNSRSCRNQAAKIIVFKWHNILGWTYFICLLVSDD